VKLVGVGAGVDYGFDGLTHFAIDDISALRPYPGFLIWAPADADEVKSDLEIIHNDARPTYIRLLRRGIKSDCPRLHTDPLISEKCVILSLGDAHPLGSKVQQALRANGVSADHISVTRIEEQTSEQVTRLLQTANLCITVESHLITGGLGSLVCEAVATNNLGVKVRRVGFEKLPLSEYGDAEYLEKRFMTDIDEVVTQICLSEEK
jgi:transketolase